MIGMYSRKRILELNSFFCQISADSQKLLFDAVSLPKYEL